MEVDVDSLGMAASSIESGVAPARDRDHNWAIEHWSKFLDRCIFSRLEPDTFESHVSLLSSKYPLPATAIADIFLKPQRGNHESLDPRIPRYIQVLAQRKLIDTPSVLKAMYKYSTSHVQTEKMGNMPPESSQDKAELRWANSYAAEEVIFYRLTKAVATGTAITREGEALAVCKMAAKWMVLFTSASAAFAQEIMGQLHILHAKTEMESARAAFVMFLLGVTENRVVLDVLGRPNAKGMFLSRIPFDISSVLIVLYGKGYEGRFRTTCLVLSRQSSTTHHKLLAALSHFVQILSLRSSRLIRKKTILITSLTTLNRLWLLTTSSFLSCPVPTLELGCIST